MRTCKAVQSGQPKEFWISTFFTFWSATVIHTKKCLMNKLLLWIRLDLIPIFSWPQLVTFLVFCWALFLYKSPKKPFQIFIHYRIVCASKWRWFKKWDLLIFGIFIRKLLDFLSEIPGLYRRAAQYQDFFIEISLVTS